MKINSLIALIALTLLMPVEPPLSQPNSCFWLRFDPQGQSLRVEAFAKGLGFLEQ